MSTDEIVADQTAVTSAEDLATIAEFGSQILTDLLTLVVAFLIYGAYICLFFSSTRILLQRWKESTSSMLLLILSGLLFISQSLRIPTLLYLVVKDVNVLLLTVSDDPVLVDRWDALAVVAHVMPIIHWTRAVTTLVADSVVVWRACMMPNGNRMVSLALTGLAICNAGYMLVFPIMLTFAKTWAMEHYEVKRHIYGATLIFSLVTNFAATAVIAWVAWGHQQTIKGVLGNARNPKVGKVLLTLVETGAIYMVLQFSNTLLSLAPSDEQASTLAFMNATSIFDELVLGFAAISPVIVIIVVQDRKSIFTAASTPSSARLPQIANFSGYGSSGPGSPTKIGMGSSGSMGSIKKDAYNFTSSSGSLERDIEKF